MKDPLPIAEIWRGDVLESLHLGHVVIADSTGHRHVWGDPDALILPRSSYKMIQALPLVASGAADAAGLGRARLALACASHKAEARHVETVSAWLGDLGLDETALRCGPQPPRDQHERDRLIRADLPPDQTHNNCSGKHTGFLTLAKHLRAGPEYLDIDHPVQRDVRAVFSELTGSDANRWSVDGCSAPNFACSIAELARAMAWFATAGTRGDRLSRSAVRVAEAMMAHPEMVAGETRACTELMRAAAGQVALKTGAEGVFVAILPGQGLGVAVKAVDGATRAAECAVTAVLVHLGVLAADHPTARRFMSPRVTNWRGIETGWIQPAPGFPG
ncbi:MAG: asparaginase [Pseudomonadota bacterium]